MLLAGQSPTLEQISNFNYANQIIERKDRLVEKYQVLKAAIAECVSIDEIDAIIVKDDAHWNLD
jgi:hypothetical protein